MLNQSVLNKVYATLEKSPFTVADFTVKPGDNPEEDVFLTVLFRHNKTYLFQIQEVAGQIWSIESPGEFRKTESKKLASYQEMPNRLAEWARNVRDELRTQLPVYDEIDELRKTIEEHVNEHIEDSDAPFSKAEADELRERLDALGAKFGELAEHNEITKQELNRIQQELTSIKANLTAFPKGTWYKTAGTKLWTVTSKVLTSTESRKVIADAARKLIGLDSTS